MPVMALPAILVAPEAMRVNAVCAAFASEPKRPCTPLTVSRTMFIALLAACPMRGNRLVKAFTMLLTPLVKELPLNSVRISLPVAFA